jgi:hypothetical protein
VQHNYEKKITWREFKRYFQKNYLTKRYYDTKMKVFFEIKFGSMTIYEYEMILLELGSMTIHPKSLEESIRTAKCLYDQHRGRPTFQKSWEDKKKSKMEQRKKGTQPPFFKNNS